MDFQVVVLAGGFSKALVPLVAKVFSFLIPIFWWGTNNSLIKLNCWYSSEILPGGAQSAPAGGEPAGAFLCSGASRAERPHKCHCRQCLFICDCSRFYCFWGYGIEDWVCVLKVVEGETAALLISSWISSTFVDRLRVEVQFQFILFLLPFCFGFI